MTRETILSGQFGAWAAKIRLQESSDNYLVDVDSGKHLGAYQMSRAALQAAGFEDKRGH